ncbi:MAG: Lin1244/Lin1753 domain-containing protein [Eubacteriales bacterium]
MARPLKDGVDYFPLDTVLDTKFELIEAEYGLTGFAVVVKLLQKIYREHGYYCEWTDEVALLFSKQLNEGCNVVSEIVRASVKRGIFDKDLFDKYHILTSNGIQKRYFEAVNRRTQINVIDEYLLVSDTQIWENVNKNQVIAYKNPENVCNNPQSKGKKSKLNKRKEEENAASAVVAAYESNIGSISRLVYDKLTAWLDSVDESLVLYAIEQAAVNGKCTYSYIEAILNNHFKCGRKTRTEAEAASRKRSEKTADKPKSRYDYEEFERKCFFNLHKDKFTEPEGAED